MSCGQRPYQSKWHVTVRNGRPTAVTVKAPKRGTSAMGVSMPEKAAIVAAAERACVWPDGSSGRSKPRHELTPGQALRDVTQSLDVERLNLFSNRLRKRLEAPDGACPPRPLSSYAE